ncbi:unnamed protein product, partial [Discosporangium mesarthrocarpum]
RTTLADQLDAILSMTVQPSGGVWVCLFDSPLEESYRRVIDSYRPRFSPEAGGGGLQVVSSSFNFKYYGRLQLALQARSSYVWLIDDDIMPGRKFLEQLSHVAGIARAGERGAAQVGPMALGAIGWVMPGVSETSGKFYSYRDRSSKGGLYLPDKRYSLPVPYLQEVDLLCSQWFVETDWVRLVFRERWVTPETGEDYMLAYSILKYAGVRSYVMPMDLRDSETWGNTDVAWEMQDQGAGATTTRSTVPVRDSLWHSLLKRGGQYFLTPRYARQPAPVAFIVSSLADAAALGPLFRVMMAKDSHHPPRLVLVGSVECAHTAENLLGKSETSSSKGLEANRPAGALSPNNLCDPNNLAGAWNLMVSRPSEGGAGTGAGGEGAGAIASQMEELVAGLVGTIETLHPLAIVSMRKAPQERGSSPRAGAGTLWGLGQGVQSAPGAGTAASRVGEGVGGGIQAGTGAGTHGEPRSSFDIVGEALAVVSTQHPGVPHIRLPLPPIRATAGVPSDPRAAGQGLSWLRLLTPGAFTAWQTPRVTVLVVHDDRHRSGALGRSHSGVQLAALLESLAGAEYLGDEVGLTVVTTGGASGIAEGFLWPHGPKSVREPLRIWRGGSGSGGAQAGVGPGVGGKGADVSGGEPMAPGSERGLSLVLGSWVPQDLDSFVLVLEADRVVSPFYYPWLKLVLLEAVYAKRHQGRDRGRGGGSGAAGKAAAAGAVEGICLPAAIPPSNGSPSMAGAGDSWLFSSSHWKAMQERCLGGEWDSLGRRAEARGACGLEQVYLTPTNSICPKLTLDSPGGSA